MPIFARKGFVLYGVLFQQRLKFNVKSKFVFDTIRYSGLNRSSKWRMTELVPNEKTKRSFIWLNMSELLLGLTECVLPQTNIRGDYGDYGGLTSSPEWWRRLRSLRRHRHVPTMNTNEYSKLDEEEKKHLKMRISQSENIGKLILQRN